MLWRIVMLIKLIELTRDMDGSNRLSEVYVNSSHIISVSEDVSIGSVLKENLGIEYAVRFSFLHISEGSRSRRLTVVGSPSEINNKIKKIQVLRG